MSDYPHLDRRDLLRHMLVLAGATATANFSLGALADVARGSLKFLDKTALDTLSAVADTIIPATDTPGALATEVPARFDAMLLNWASADTREMIVGALGRIDAASQAAKGKVFAGLSADERKAFLIEHDNAALQPAPPPPNAQASNNPFLAQGYVVDNGYQRVKGLIFSLHYVSEIAMTQELVYQHVPGAWVPSLKITPGMRPFASPNLM